MSRFVALTCLLTSSLLLGSLEESSAMQFSSSPETEISKEDCFFGVLGGLVAKGIGSSLEKAFSPYPKVKNLLKRGNRVVPWIVGSGVLLMAWKHRLSLMTVPSNESSESIRGEGSVVAPSSNLIGEPSSSEHVVAPNFTAENLERPFEGCSDLLLQRFRDSLSSPVLSHTELDHLTIPEGTRSIDGDAFVSHPNLGWVTIPESVDSIDSQAFANCEHPLTIEVSNRNLERLGSDWIPENTHLIISGEGVVPAFCFCGCDGLREVTLREGIWRIEEGAFDHCANLEQVHLPQSLNSIGRLAFGCSGLTEIDVPENVRTIAESVFDACGNLTRVTLPARLESIGRRAFALCGHLERLSFVGDVSDRSLLVQGISDTSRNRSFLGTPSFTIQLPNGIRQRSQDFWRRSLLRGREIFPSAVQFVTEDGQNFVPPEGVLRGRNISDLGEFRRQMELASTEEIEEELERMSEGRDIDMTVVYTPQERVLWRILRERWRRQQRES